MGMDEDSRKRIEEAEAANRERFYERMERTRANIREAAQEAEQHLDRMQEALNERATVTELRPRKVPLATLELEEEELHWMTALANDAGRGKAPFAVAESVRGKLNQALALEAGPGGKFHGGGDAA